MTADTTARDLRALMRDEQVNVATLAWILRTSRVRALRLRYWSRSWTVAEAFSLCAACKPASRSVPLWGTLAGIQ